MIVDLVATLAVIAVVLVALALLERRFVRQEREAWRRVRLEYLQAAAAERARRMDGPPRPRLRVVKGGRA